MSLPKQCNSYVKTKEQVEVIKKVPIIEKNVVETIVPTLKTVVKRVLVEEVVPVVKKTIEKKVVGQKEELKTITKTHVKTVSTINHKDVEYNEKKYVVGYTQFNNEDVLFIFDAELKEKIIHKKWHTKTETKYIAHTYYEDDEFKQKRDLYMHNYVMNKLSHDGKGQHHSVDHINRIPRDNRLENLRILSQSCQNMNQKKRERNIELPKGCGINPQDIPKNIFYHAQDKTHGERFEIDIKLENDRIRWKSTSNKEVSLEAKLYQAILKLEDLKKTNSEVKKKYEEYDNVKQRNELRKSFNEILKLSGYPENIINSNLAPIEKEEIETITIKKEDKELGKKLFENGTARKDVDELAESGIEKTMVPKYCYFQASSDKRGCKFVIDKHPKLIEEGKRQWSTSESRSMSIKDKYKALINKLKELGDNIDTSKMKLDDDNKELLDKKEVTEKLKEIKKEEKEKKEKVKAEKKKNEEIELDIEDEIVEALNDSIKEKKPKPLVSDKFPDNCDVDESIMPKYCRYVAATKDKGDYFVIENHHKMIKHNMKPWKSPSDVEKTTREKFNIMMQKLAKINKLN